MVNALLLQDYYCTLLNCTGPGTSKMQLCISSALSCQALLWLSLLSLQMVPVYM